MPKLKTRVCANCGKTFQTRYGQTFLCSDECRKIRYLASKAEYNERQSKKCPCRRRPFKKGVNSDLINVARKAYELGVSYGYYVGVIEK